jgi:hypothetical protein
MNGDALGAATIQSAGADLQTSGVPRRATRNEEE